MHAVAACERFLKFFLYLVRFQRSLFIPILVAVWVGQLGATPTIDVREGGTFFLLCHFTFRSYRPYDR